MGQHAHVTHPSRGSRGSGFALLSSAFLDELRARTSLSNLVRRSVKLQKAGNEWKAPCPFHNEKTPSFYVNDDKQFYHCFGCGAHGDAIRWMTDQRGLQFMDAVKELADAAGMEMPAPDPIARQRAEKAASLHDITEASACWFVDQLNSHRSVAARDYLATRGLSEATIIEFRLGYAPFGRRHLADGLSHFPVESLIETGMLIQPEDGGTPYDRFRDRLMIPIADARGRVIAFGGRILAQGEPKYLNSPETPLFDKGSTLWNLHRAAPASRQANRLIIVEGYLDAIALHQAGIREAVAPLGTALTEKQMERAWSLVDVPLLCLDGDAAGQKAALRAADRALPIMRPGKSLVFATLPSGMDPDELIQFGGVGEFEKAIANPISMVELLYRREHSAGDMNQPEQRAGLRSRLDALADSCTDHVMAREFRRSFADRFFEDYGWKRGERKTLRSDLLHTMPRKPGDIGSSILRSVLFGLQRFPKVLQTHADQLAGLKIDNERLSRSRHTLVESVWKQHVLHGPGQDAIVLSDGLPIAANDAVRIDLRFAFDRSDVAEARQSKILGGLVSFLCHERELDESLSGLDRAALAAATEDEYLAIEAERQYLRDQRLSLFEWAYELGAGEQD